MPIFRRKPSPSLFLCLLTLCTIIAPLAHAGNIAPKQAKAERERLEAELRRAQKMEAIGTLAGGIAHAFNNILGIVVGNAELAREDIPDRNPAQQNLDGIMSASIRAKEVLRQLLTFSLQ